MEFDFGKEFVVIFTKQDFFELIRNAIEDEKPMDMPFRIMEIQEDFGTDNFRVFCEFLGN